MKRTCVNRLTQNGLGAVSELILSKEQLYEMFQQILGIKKLEHQLLYNACQVSDYAISSSAV